MSLAAIALGSNLPSRFGDPAANLREAVRRMAAVGRMVRVSTFVRTSPVGYLEQPDFFNAAALLETTLTPEALLEELLGIELAMGRDRLSVPKKGPRPIDLDLLLYDAMVVATPRLTLPHPEMTRRRFVLEPLAQIAPTMLDPVSGQTVLRLLQRLGPAAPREERGG